MARFNMASLQKRVASAVILAPIFAGFVWYGSWPFLIWLVIAACIAMYEWRGLIVRLNDGKGAALFFGFVYISLSFYSFYLCRGLGGAHIILLLLLVWSSDIGAYFFGKFIGGAKLLPQISPNKTWAGMIGAMFCPVVVLLLFMYFYVGIGGMEAYIISFLLIVGALIGVLGQAGDLLISYVKRQARVKDTGNLIPGHGGLLDRIDSLLLVTPVFYVMLKYTLVIIEFIQK